jgi:hypothetical protein
MTEEDRARWDLWWAEKTIAIAESAKARARECRTSVRIIGMQSIDEKTDSENICDVVCLSVAAINEGPPADGPIRFAAVTPPELAEQVPVADGIICCADTGLEPDHASAIAARFKAPAYPVELQPLRSALWHLARAITVGPPESAIVRFHSETEAIADAGDDVVFLKLAALSDEMEDWLEANPGGASAPTIAAALRLVKLALLWQDSGETSSQYPAEVSRMHSV